MNEIISLVSLSVIFGSLLSGFATFRMTGMRLMPHFALLIISFILTLIYLALKNPMVGYLSILAQILSVISICPTICNILKTQFQNSAIYSSHLSMMGILLVLAIGNLFI
ncbi:conserved hypothetical protein [Methanocaldococcus infernus ME]|uniref:Uncharacterized protein n=1 Tax=Methanocaldococcus infernus (strain DSM 11812 / JCM 15783 / ME) TaxID=573063 RepID=D5VR27_METIM|nr:DUF5400 domain-containing protein [Methanocaldococcus infernus]ADG13030.1 conserved hypothetical protein [Methanocaldococcus infernus ME]